MNYSIPKYYKFFNLFHLIIFIFITILLFDFLNLLDPWEERLEQSLFIVSYISLGVGIFNLIQFIIISFVKHKGIKLSHFYHKLMICFSGIVLLAYGGFYIYLATNIGKGFFEFIGIFLLVLVLFLTSSYVFIKTRKNIKDVIEYLKKDKRDRERHSLIEN